MNDAQRLADKIEAFFTKNPTVKQARQAYFRTKNDGSVCATCLLGAASIECGIDVNNAFKQDTVSRVQDSLKDCQIDTSRWFDFGGKTGMDRLDSFCIAQNDNSKLSWRAVVKRLRQAK